MKEEMFGKDLGLIHGVVSAGREVGADHDFWSYLVYDKKVFGQVVQLVKGERAKWLTLDSEEVESIQKWLTALVMEDCPYPESETYYTRSSHSEYDERFHNLHHEEFGEIFRKASQSKKVAKLCRLIEATFVVSYLLSGYYSAEQDPEGKQKDWMHGPFSITTYFHDIWNCDPRAPVGCFFKNQDLLEMEGMKDLYKLTTKQTGWGKQCIGEIVERLRNIKIKVVGSLQKELDQVQKG